MRRRRVAADDLEFGVTQGDGRPSAARRPSMLNLSRSR